MTGKTVLTASRTERRATVALLPVAGAGVVIVALGMVAGCVLVFIARQEEVTVVVTDTQVEIIRGSSERSYRAADVREALVDGKHLVLLAGNGTELARVRTEFARSALGSAFRTHGYDWAGAA